jgi:undecaprenyl-diphosphatase
MNLEYALLLAVIQGLTEFLPISSSAHLILPSAVLGWVDQGLAFDVAVHLGSLIAVVLALRARLGRLIKGVYVGMGRRYPRHARLGWMIAAATLPAVVAGVLLKSWIEGELRAIGVIAATTIGFGLLLWWADRRVGQRGMSHIRWRDVLIIGMAQAVALIPGTSRSGITLTAALALGWSRRAAAEFSFLMSVPVIFGASLLKGWDLLSATETVPWLEIGMGTVASGLSAYVCIRLFLGLIQRIGVKPFVMYRLALGVVLLIVLWIP